MAVFNRIRNFKRQISKISGVVFSDFCPVEGALLLPMQCPYNALPMQCVILEWSSVVVPLVPVPIFVFSPLEPKILPSSLLNNYCYLGVRIYVSVHICICMYMSAGQGWNWHVVATGRRSSWLSGSRSFNHAYEMSVCLLTYLPANRAHDFVYCCPLT